MAAVLVHQYRRRRKKEKEHLLHAVTFCLYYSKTAKDRKEDRIAIDETKLSRFGNIIF